MGFSRPLQAKLMVVLSIILEQDLFETNFIGLAGVNFVNILCTNFLNECLFGSFFYVHVTREKLPKQCLYKKFVRYMLMKLTTGVNFINILHTTFSYKNVLHSFSLVTVWLGIFWHKNISTKAAIKMLMNDEIDPWCHFNTIYKQIFGTKVLCAAFFGYNWYKKFTRKMWDEIDYRFHQHFTYSFFIRKRFVLTDCVSNFMGKRILDKKLLIKCL